MGPHILIADDHDLFRRGLRYALMDTMPDVRVSEADSLDRALEILAEFKDIALASFDLRMPGMREGKALPNVRRLYPILPIAVLSGREGRRVILEAPEFGASGFIPKTLPAEDLVTAMCDIMDGRIYVPPNITAIGSDKEPEPEQIIAFGQTLRQFDPAGLTPRQRDVFDLLLAGKSTKEMARTLDIAEGTVKIYLAAIFRLLEARNRLEAVTKAIRFGFTPGPKGTL